MNGTLGPASEVFWARAVLWCTVVIILIADRRYCRCVHTEAQIQSIKFPLLIFFLFCYCLSLSSPLPVFNFLMNSCWQPPHFTSSWQVKHPFWGLMLMQKQTRTCVMLYRNPATFSLALLSALPDTYWNCIPRKGWTDNLTLNLSHGNRL